MNQRRLKIAAGCLGPLILLGSLACESSDPVATDGSTIVLTANPANLPEGVGLVLPSTITAVVFGPSGVPSKGIQVFFTTEDGGLSKDRDPEAPRDAFQQVLTSDDGIAQVFLFTLVSTEVRGQSGSAVDEVTVTVGGQQVIGTVNLTVITPGVGDGVPRGSTVAFTASVLDTEGLPVVGTLVTVDVEPATGGVPAPVSGLSDDFGEFDFSVEDIDETIDVTARAGGVESDVVLIVVTGGGG